MSHVLEKLLLTKTFHVKDKKVEVSEEQMVEGREWLLKVCRFVTNKLEDFSHDVYASHLLSTCTQCLSGERSPSSAWLDRVGARGQMGMV